MLAGRSVDARARNAGAPAVANKACVVVVSAAIVALAWEPLPITTALLVKAAALVTHVGQEIVPAEVIVPPEMGAVVAMLVTVPVAALANPRVTLLPATVLAVITWPAVGAVLGSNK